MERYKQLKFEEADDSVKWIFKIIDDSMVEQVGNFNDQITREEIVTVIKNGLFNKKLEDFEIICDSDLNPPELIDRNTLRVKVKLGENLQVGINNVKIYREVIGKQVDLFSVPYPKDLPEVLDFIFNSFIIRDFEEDKNE